MRLGKAKYYLLFHGTLSKKQLRRLKKDWEAMCAKGLVPRCLSNPPWPDGDGHPMYLTGPSSNKVKS